MKRFLLTSTALIFALQTGVADAEEMVVRQAQLIDFARPLTQKENIPAVENDMRNQFAAIAPEELNREPARLRLGRLKYLRTSRGAPRARSAKSRGGQECGRTCSTRWWPEHKVTK